MIKIFYLRMFIEFLLEIKTTKKIFQIPENYNLKNEILHAENRECLIPTSLTR